MKNRSVDPIVELGGEPVSAKTVEMFLQTHPEFFANRDDLLLGLRIPHTRGSTISLVERQVSLLRERNQTLQDELDDLLSAAKKNDATFIRCRRLVLALLDADNPATFLDHLETRLTLDFGCNAYRLLIYADKPKRLNSWASIISNDDAKVNIGGLVGSRKPVFGTLRDSESEYLFGASWKEVKSTAVFPIRKKKDIAVLALGSANINQFESGMGTLFTDLITDALARLIPRLQFN